MNANDRERLVELLRALRINDGINGHMNLVSDYAAQQITDALLAAGWHVECAPASLPNHPFEKSDDHTCKTCGLGRLNDIHMP